MVDVDKICSHKDGCSPIQMPCCSRASKRVILTKIRKFPLPPSFLPFLPSRLVFNFSSFTFPLVKLFPLKKLMKKRNKLGASLCNANRTEQTTRMSGRETGRGRRENAPCNVKITRNKMPAYHLFSFHSMLMQFFSLPKTRHLLTNVIASLLII